MKAVGVFLGGEGPNELGRRGNVGEAHPGVIETLLRKVQADGWEVAGATPWTQIVKLSAKGPTPREERNVLGLVLEAKRAGAQVVAFLRDADDDAERPEAIAAAIVRARKEYPDVDVIGGSPIPVLEAWLLALLGTHKTETLRKSAAQKKYEAMGYTPKRTAEMAQVVQNADLEKLPPDAERLLSWLKTARDVLPARVRSSVE